jgi:hypothetical protein
MRDPQLLSIECQVALLARQIFSKSGNSFEQYVHRFSHEIYFESKRRSGVEREMLIDTATKHGFDEAIIQIKNQSDLKTDSNHYTYRLCSATHAIQ